MILILSQPPMAEPVTLPEFKNHLRIDHALEDTLLSSLISTAREYLEKRTGLALMDQEWRLCLDEWPEDRCIQIQKSPIRSIDEVQQFGIDGQPNIVAQNNMLLDGKSSPARLFVGPQLSPEQMMNGIEITFTAGYTSASEVPDALKRAILIHAACLYEFRGVVAPDMQPAAVPNGYDALISQWVRRRI
ncbi:head-tail connector protein [Lentilitoribacter sp. Alg239-R112]|uniref:head-tail connector protein n=1 Tax=Lentilitoribacter sp. Alg239-R112 TaxID=2305987 RepID=UPI0013A6CE02|nr:head-tail connector protein [Lentilitoribacter sp. Alg239-R112]